MVFIYASFSKLLHPQAFSQAVFNYQILPDTFINLTALTLPWLELIVGSCLILNKWMPGAVVITTLLLAIFMAAMTYNLSRGLNVECGCFSSAPGEDAISNLLLLRDLFFLAISILLLSLTFFQKNSIRVSEQQF